LMLLARRFYLGSVLSNRAMKAVRNKEELSESTTKAEDEAICMCVS